MSLLYHNYILRIYFRSVLGDVSPIYSNSLRTGTLFSRTCNAALWMRDGFWYQKIVSSRGMLYRVGILHIVTTVQVPTVYYLVPPSGEQNFLHDCHIAVVLSLSLSGYSSFAISSKRSVYRQRLVRIDCSIINNGNILILY